MTKKINPNITKSEALIKAWHSRSDFKGYDKTKGSSYNSWRAIVYTIKGKEIGFPNSWKDYNIFMNEVNGSWEKGKIVCRLNTKFPHSKENSIWRNKGEENINKLITFTYNNKTQTLIEWSKELKLNYQGIRQRYYKGKNLTAKEILYGKVKKVKVSPNRNKHNRLVRMLAAYKLSDTKKGYDYNIDLEFAENLIKDGCIYCGDTSRIGLDRIDNKKGHIKDNVVPACYICNTTRMDHFSHEEMLVIGETIKKIKQWRLEKKI